MKERFPLHNSVIPGKVYSIRDRAWNNIGEISASSAVEALREACYEWGAQSRTACRENKFWIKLTFGRLSALSTHVDEAS